MRTWNFFYRHFVCHIAANWRSWLASCIHLTLSLLRLRLSIGKKCKKFWKTIGKLSLGTLRWVPICHGFSHFPAFFIILYLTKLAISSQRVKENGIADKFQLSLVIGNFLTYSERVLVRSSPRPRLSRECALIIIVCFMPINFGNIPEDSNNGYRPLFITINLKVLPLYRIETSITAGVLSCNCFERCVVNCMYSRCIPNKFINVFLNHR